MERKIMRKNLTKIEINTSFDVLTSETLGKLLTEIIEFLIFHRNQIPFVYNTYKHLVKSFEKICDDDVNWNASLLNNHRELARETLNLVEDITKDILKESNRGLSEAIIMFGSTELTPIETYVLRFPKININSKDHIPENHITCKNKFLRSCLLQLITNESFNFQTSAPLKITNMHLLLRRPTTPKDLPHEIFCENENLDDFLLPNSKRIEINFINKINEKSKLINCCRKLIVFEDMTNLHLDDKIEVDENFSKDDEKFLENTSTHNWYKSEIIVKGFKDLRIKGKFIWDK